MKHLHDTRRLCPRKWRQAGQVLVLFALMLPVLVGAVGLMVDLALITRAHARLQAVAASAARAGAQEISAGWLASTDTFLLSSSTAETAAQQVCSAYKQDALLDLSCAVDVSPLLADTQGWSSAADAAWLAYLFRDPTERYPGYTVHGSVTVTASQNVRLFFLPALTHQPQLRVAAHQSATPVSGV